MRKPHFVPLLINYLRDSRDFRLHLRRGQTHSTEYRHGSVLLPESFCVPLRLPDGSLPNQSSDLFC